MVHSTMQDFALTVPAILRHGTTVHEHREVRTLQPNTIEFRPRPVIWRDCEPPCFSRS